MSRDEAEVILCNTPECDGFVESREEPCPRCGRVPDDPTPADIEHEFEAMAANLRQNIREIEWRQNPEPEPELNDN